MRMGREAAVFSSLSGVPIHLKAQVWFNAPFHLLFTTVIFRKVYSNLRVRDSWDVKIFMQILLNTLDVIEVIYYTDARR